MKRLKVMFHWEEEGDGWVGRYTIEGVASSMCLTIEPEGGLHGGWKWSNPWCHGVCHDADNATVHCEATLRAIIQVEG